MPKALRTSAWIAVALTFALIILGGWVRATNSGLSCPDWPTCYGHWLLTPADFAAQGDVGYSYFQVMLEWGHRFVAAFLVGPIVLLVAILAWRTGGLARTLGIAVLVLLLVQGALGGVTVLDRNSPWSVALHLGNALLILGLLVGLATVTEACTRSAPTALRVGALLVCGLAFVAMITAAMTAKSGGSLACSTWPDCGGTFLPALDDPLVRLHFLHRLFAFLTAIGIAVLALMALRREGWSGFTTGLSAIVTLQVALGAVVILREVPVWAAVAHQATGVALFVVLMSFTWRLWAAPSAEVRPTLLERDVRLRSA